MAVVCLPQSICYLNNNSTLLNVHLGSGNLVHSLTLYVITCLSLSRHSSLSVFKNAPKAFKFMLVHTLAAHLEYFNSHFTSSSTFKMLENVVAAAFNILFNMLALNKCSTAVECSCFCCRGDSIN